MLSIAPDTLTELIAQQGPKLRNNPMRNFLVMVLVAGILYWQMSIVIVGLKAKHNHRQFGVSGVLLAPFVLARGLVEAIIFLREDARWWKDNYLP